MKVYVTEEEKDRLRQRASRLNRSLSEYMRLAAGEDNLKGLLKVLARVDLRVMNIELRRLADRAEREGLKSVRAAVEHVIQQVEDAAKAVAGDRFDDRERKAAGGLPSRSTLHRQTEAGGGKG